MILTHRWLVLWLLLVAVAGVLGLSTAAYLMGTGSVSMTKLTLENLLFVGFLVTALLLVLGVWVLMTGDSVLRRMDRVIEMARQGSASVPQLLSRMGPIGERIIGLQNHLDETSEKRAQRISVLSELTAFLLANAAIPLAVVDLGGKIVSASNLMLKRRKPEDPEVVDREVTDLITPEKFSTVILKLERSRVAYTSENGEMQFHPVLNREDQLALVICVFGKAEVRTAAVSGRAASPPHRRSTIERRLRGSRRDCGGGERWNSRRKAPHPPGTPIAVGRDVSISAVDTGKSVYSDEEVHHASILFSQCLAEPACRRGSFVRAVR